MKKKIRIILIILLISVTLGFGSAYATYNYFAKDIIYSKNGENISVDKALNELYQKKDKEVYLDKKWSEYFEKNIDYSYNATEDGCYLVGIMCANSSKEIPDIKTNRRYNYYQIIKLLS